MFLFIFESLGTSELLLIGIIALVFLGPRRLPEIARKIGKMMAEFRGTANEFRSTWEREVDFEEEKKAFRLDLLEEEVEKPVARENSILGNSDPVEVQTPTVKQIDKEQFDLLQAEAVPMTNGSNADKAEGYSEESDMLSDKRNWL